MNSDEYHKQLISDRRLGPSKTRIAALLVPLTLQLKYSASLFSFRLSLHRCFASKPSMAQRWQSSMRSRASSAQRVCHDRRFLVPVHGTSRSTSIVRGISIAMGEQLGKQGCSGGSAASRSSRSLLLSLPSRDALKSGLSIVSIRQTRRGAGLAVQTTRLGPQLRLPLPVSSCTTRVRQYQSKHSSK